MSSALQINDTPKHGGKRTLRMPQRLDGIKVGSAKGRVNAKDDTDANRDTECECYRPVGKKDGQLILIIFR